MANNDIGDIFNSFGCFGDSDVPSLFDDLEAISDMSPTVQDLAEIGIGSGPTCPDENDTDMMSVGSGSPQHQSSSFELEVQVDLSKDHCYANNMDRGNPVMTGAASPEHHRSPSPGGSLSSTAEQEESRDLLLYLMNETGVQIAEKEESSQQSEPKRRQRLPRSSASNARGRKRHQSDEADDENNSDELLDKNRKNAIAARENRLKKKKYIEGLEKENKTLSTDNAQLIKDNNEMKERVSSLEAEIDYLKSVLYNQSTLSGLLKKLGPDSQVRLSSSFSGRNQPTAKKLKTSGSSGGVCLHVNGKDASLEFCAQCAVMAEGATQQ